jgi:hypothetical protein
LILLLVALLSVLVAVVLVVEARNLTKVEALQNLTIELLAATPTPLSSSTMSA